MRFCPKCLRPTVLIGKTSGAGPIEPWTCGGCHRAWFDKDLIPATAETSNG